MPSLPRERIDLRDALTEWQRLLPGSHGEKYLARRRVPLELAKFHGLGYCPARQWPGRKEARKCPRIVFPLETPDGELVGLYSRGVDYRYPAKLPKEIRHDIIGRKGLFNAPVIQQSVKVDGIIYIVEGVFDALAMIQSGYPSTVALVGTDGLPWEWLRGVRQVHLCLDRDDGGLAKARKLAHQAALKGITAFLPAEDAYGGYSEPSEQYEATGTVTLGVGLNVTERASQAGGVAQCDDSPAICSKEFHPLTEESVARALEVSQRTEELLTTRGWCLWQCEAFEGETVVIARDAQTKGYPRGLAVYTEAELKELFGSDKPLVKPATLRLIHEAKRYGAVVVAWEAKTEETRRFRDCLSVDTIFKTSSEEIKDGAA